MVLIQRQNKLNEDITERKKISSENANKKKIQILRKNEHISIENRFTGVFFYFIMLTRACFGMAIYNK